jgi:uncharacterized small protein (DUF1192 family)
MPDENHLPRWRAPVDVDDLTRYQTRAVKAANRMMYDAFERGDVDTALKANTRLTQAVQTCLKVLQVGELEERVQALEQAQEQRSTNGIMHN